MRQAVWGAALAALIGAPGLAAAQGACPAGLARDGVWIEFPDRTVLTRVLSDGRVAETEFMFEDGAIYGYITLPIGLVTDSWRLVNGRVPAVDRERVTYTGTPAAVPAPEPGARFDGMEFARYDDGGEVRYAITVTVGAPQPFAIGSCTYTGLPVEVTRVEQGGPMFRDSMMHLGELGVTIYLGFSEGGGAPVPVLPVAIASEPPPEGGAGGQTGVAPPPLPPAPAGPSGPPQK